MTDRSSLLIDLQSWYKAQCDGNWEEDFGVTINTLDNPGWSVIIDLNGTWLEDRQFQSVKDDSEDSWIDCSVSEKTFRAFCGPSDFERVLTIFVDWAKSGPNWLVTPPNAPKMLTERQREQTNWDALNQEPQAEKCQQEGCKRHRIQYSVFCRRHQYEQLHKKAPPQGHYEIWVYGRDEMVQEAKARIIASVSEMYGVHAVRAAEQADTTILTIQWLKKDIELALLDVPQEALFKIMPTENGKSNAEHIMRLFFCDFVEPVKDTTGSVVATLNFWTPSEC